MKKQVYNLSGLDRYPNATSFINKLKPNNNMYKAFGRHCGANKKQVNDTYTPGRGPVIKLISQDTNPNAPTNAYGYVYKDDDPNTIYLNDQMLQDLESAPSNSQYQNTVDITIGHETSHSLDGTNSKGFFNKLLDLINPLPSRNTLNKIEGFLTLPQGARYELKAAEGFLIEKDVWGSAPVVNTPRTP